MKPVRTETQMRFTHWKVVRPFQYKIHNCDETMNRVLNAVWEMECTGLGKHRKQWWKGLSLHPRFAVHSAVDTESVVFFQEGKGEK